eukprot:m.44619 g.44619  ORF g.44619 m.44619 type:complete len:165 (+) comp6203_c0_seq1:562-1056(+)
MEKTLRALRHKERVEIPVYDRKTCRRTGETKVIDGADVVIVEGILILYDPKIRDLLHLKVFVQVDSDTRLTNRLERDATMDRDLEEVLRSYMLFVKPCYDEFIAPTKKYADIIIPRGAENHVAVQLLGEQVKRTLKSPGSFESILNYSSSFERSYTSQPISRPH